MGAASRCLAAALAWALAAEPVLAQVGSLPHVPAPPLPAAAPLLAPALRSPSLSPRARLGGRLRALRVKSRSLAEWMLNIAVSILSIGLFGFALKGVSTAAALALAASAATVLALLRLASPWLFFRGPRLGWRIASISS